MRRKSCRNEQGSVLLAVVCMSMMCMTLATIALSVVNSTTIASSENVQRTQAKVTAEACLTEYINSYNNNYETLKSLASSYTQSNPYVLDVSVDGDSDFDTTYGKTQLKIYTITGSSSFKVESTCTYSTKTQTASIVFDAVRSNPYTPTNALESSDGVDFKDGKANPVDGDIYLETKKNATAADPDYNYITLGNNDAEFHSHVYSEYNLMFNSNTKFLDTTNKSGTLNYEPNKTSGNGNYFIQAPTIMTEGYLFGYNSVTISTDVGKTDTNMKNSDDYTSGGTYSNSNLSNKDGFIYANKKIYFGMPGAMHIGTADSSDSTKASRPIDVYSHGLYFGFLPEKTDGTTNPDYSAIQTAFNSTATGQEGALTINGNVYSYIGSGTYQNGDVYILDNAQTITVNGDMFVEGNLYIQTGSGSNSGLKVNGALHCNKNIFFVEYSGGDCIIKGVATVDGSSIVPAEYTTSSGTVIPKSACTSAMISQISATSIDNSIDKNVERNKFPSAGYEASTATDNVTRKTLSQIYANATTNKMFSASLGDKLGTTSSYEADAKYIAKKYAQAMTRTLDTKKFKDSNGNEKTLSKTWNNGGKLITEIYGSLRLRSSDFGGLENSGSKFYSVKLTDEDIVIAIPLDAGNITPKIRVDSSEAQSGCFVYFMYYQSSDTFDFTDSDEANNVITCYYLDTSDSPTTLEVDNIEIYDNSTNSFSNQKVIFNKTDEATRSSKTITYDAGGQNICFVADATIYSAYRDSETIDFTKYYTLLQQTLTSAVTAIDSDTGEGYSNRIIFLVPDNVGFSLGDNTELQGIIYAAKSKVSFGGSGTTVYGQVKCGTFSTPNDAKSGMIQNVPPASDSILGFLGIMNASTSSIEIQYYEY